MKGGRNSAKLDFNPSLSVHRLIYDNVLERLGVLCNVKDTIYVALEMSVVFPCHVIR